MLHLFLTDLARSKYQGVCSHGVTPIADWPEPLTAHQLIAKLRELAEVAQGDSRHDFGTALDTFSSRERMARRPAFSPAGCEQILRAVRDSILQAPAWRSDLTALNKHLFDKREHLVDEAGRRRVLPALLRAAADRIETSLRDQAREGGCDHV